VPYRLRCLLFALAALAIVSAACGSDDAADQTPSATIATTPSAEPTSDQPSTTQLPGSDQTAEPPAATGPSITISAVGDISLARQVVERMEQNGAGYPYARITPLLTGDIVVGNLEGALTNRGDPWPKGYTFRTPPVFASGLREAGFDLVSLANNHTLDYGAVGLLDTIDALDVVRVAHVGAGRDSSLAHNPVILDANGLTVAFLGYAQTPSEGGGFSIEQWAASPSAAGIALPSSRAIAADIAAARQLADFVVVLVHAGSEYVNTPDDTQRRIVDDVLAAGADAYIGAHAHVVQPIEQRGEQLIAWGLGNFIFDLDEVDLANIPEPRVSLVLNFTLTKDAGVTSFEAVPVTLDDAEDRPRPPTSAEADVLRSLITP
jgi:poly-gamma-glutamate synthesis protein (capsule biosynthesis protein)